MEEGGGSRREEEEDKEEKEEENESPTRSGGFTAENDGPSISPRRLETSTKKSKAPRPENGIPRDQTRRSRRKNKDMHKGEPCGFVGRPLLPHLPADRCWLRGG
jgi:hypothetical protein